MRSQARSEAQIWQAFQGRLQDWSHARQQPPVLVLLVGVPGSGKSYLARDLARQLPAVIVEADAIRKALFPRPRYNRVENEVVHGLAQRMMVAALARQFSVIDDATNLIEAHRRKVYDLAHEMRVPLAMIRVTASEPVILQRLQARQGSGDGYSDATWDIYRRMWATQERIGRPHWTVNTGPGYAADLSRVLGAIREIQVQPVQIRK